MRRGEAPAEPRVVAGYRVHQLATGTFLNELRQIVAQMELRRVAGELSAALEGMRELRSLLPICAWCKNICDDAGYWGRVEEYLHEQTGADLTHGICPACVVKMSASLDTDA